MKRGSLRRMPYQELLTRTRLVLGRMRQWNERATMYVDEIRRREKLPDMASPMDDPRGPGNGEELGPPVDELR